MVNFEDTPATGAASDPTSPRMSIGFRDVEANIKRIFQDKLKYKVIFK